MSRELCIMACVFCRDKKFHDWMRSRAAKWFDDGKVPIPEAYNEVSAKKFILGACGIESRNQLDTSAVAAERFHNLIRRPFLDWKAAQEIGQVLP